MKHQAHQLKVLTLSLMAVFSTTALADETNVSGNLNNQEIATPTTRNDGNNLSGSLNDKEIATKSASDTGSHNSNSKPATGKDDLAVNQSFDLNGNAESVSENSGNLKNNETPVAKTTNTANATELPSITVKGERKIKPTERYQHAINRNQIEHQASGNGDIGSALRSLPNVQFDNAQRSSKTPGEISPADISISGGQHYQNLFLLDGVSINTDLDPANKSAYYWGLPPGRSQGMNVNVDLLDSIKVLDSNVGARYSGFNGGVVIAETRKPEKDFGFQISHQYTNGNIDKGFPHSLTKYHIYGDEAELDSFKNSWSKNNQPLFYKHITKMSAESVINDEWSVIGQFNRTYSKIPLRLHTDTHKNTIGGYNETESNPIDPANMDKIKQNQERYSYNAFIKAYYDPSPDLGFELSYAYMPDWSREYMVAAKDFFYDTKHGGHQLTGKMKWNNDWGKLTNTMGFSRKGDEITTHGYRDWKYWVASENKNWGADAGWNITEGGYPASVSHQTTFSNELIQEFKPFKLGNTEHTVSAGSQIELVRADFQYGEEHYLGNGWTKPMTKEQQQKCIDGKDYAWCDPSKAYESFYGERGSTKNPINGDTVVEYIWTDHLGATKHSRMWPYGQWRDSIWHFRNDKIKVSDNKIGFFLEDSVKIPTKYGEWTAIPGVRVDYNSFMKKTDFSPRFSLDYGFAWNESKPQNATHLTYGWNRYYGRNMYSYGLQDGWRAMRTDIRRSDVDKTPEEILANGRECTDSKDYNDCIVKYLSDTKFTELDTPYVDEQMFGFSQNFAGFNLTAKYLHRNGRKEVVVSKKEVLGLNDDGYYTANYNVYTNNGRSKTDVVTLKLENEKPIKLWGVDNKISLGADWTRVKRNKLTYADSFSTPDFQDDYILWDGKAIRWSERPVDNFAKPYSIKLTTDHAWKMLGGKWHINNLFAFKQGHKANVRAREQNASGKWQYATVSGADYGVPQSTLDVYKVQKLPSTFTWDLRLGAEYEVYKKNKLFFNIDVMNVTNKKNVGLATLSYSDDAVTPTYEVGRQFWFELGYKF